MEAPGYEGGIGGKLRRQRPALRRAASTPYDRPASAARGGRGPPAVPGGGGWLAKIVDPASRFIASSANMLFSSVFRRQLPALPPVAEAPGETSGLETAVAEVAEAVSKEPSAELQKNNDSKSNTTNNPDNDLVMEFQQLLKQKTITRVQFEHLTNILQSRTIDLDVPKPAVSVEKLEDANISLPEKEKENNRPHEDHAEPANILAIDDDQVASPVELAKAYMGSRVSKVSPSSLSWQSHLFHENKNVASKFTSIKQSDTRGPRSVQFSGYAETPQSSYMTPKYHGRSAMYRMAYSPYFKGEGSSKDGSVGSMSLQTPSARQSGGGEVLKRRGSVLDNDFGSVGPIRRIRQKVMAASSKKLMHSVPSGTIHPSRLISTKKEIMQGHSLHNQRPLCLDVAEETGVRRISNSDVVPVLPQSTDMGNRILQQLDKLVPSPKEKSPKPNYNLLDGSPSNKVLAFSKGINNSSSYKQKRVEVNETNCPSTSTSGVKSGSAANDVHSNVGFSNSIISFHQKSAFKMSESVLVSKVNLVDPSSELKHKDEDKLSHDKSFEPSTTMTFGFPSVTSTNIPESSSILSKGADLKLSGDSASENRKGFTFPAVVSSAFSQPPPTPTMPSPSVGKALMQKEQSIAPLFSFGSKGTDRVKNTSATPASSSHAMSSLGNGISNAATSSSLKSSGSDKGEDKSVSNPPIVFSFGTSHSESLPNGSPISSSPSSSSAAQVTVLPGGTDCNTFSDTMVVLASSSDASTSPPAGKLEESPSNPLLFSSINATSDKSAVFKYGGNSSSVPLATSQFSGANTSSILAATTLLSTGNGSASASSNLFTGISPPFPSSGASNSLFNFGSTKTVDFSSPAVVSSTKTSPSATAGGIFGTQSTQGKSGTSQFSLGFPSEFQSSHSSPTFGMHASSPSSLSSSQFGTSATDTKPFISSSAPSFSVGAGFSTLSAPFPAAITTEAMTTTTTAMTNNIFSSIQSSISPASGIFTSSSSSPAMGFSFGASTSAAGIIGSSTSSTTMGFAFASTSAGIFGSSSSSPATGVAFGASSTGSGNALSAFGSSSSPAFSLNSASANTSTISPGFPTVGSLNSAACSGSPGNDQMNTEDSMAEDTNQSAGNMVPQFGQPGITAPSPVFGAPTIQPTSSIFQFGGQSNSSFPSNLSSFQASANQQSPSPFQASASQEFPQGGSFSLGSGGGEKSGRRIVKVRRDKLRKK